MQQKNKKIVTLLVIMACVGIVLGVKFYQDHQAISSTTGREKGNPSAPIQIVEFIDFQCPACAVGAKFLKEYMGNNPDDIHLVMKYFPLRMHTHGLLSARFTECASQQDKFWEMHDVIIDKQKEWGKLINAYPSFLLMAQGVDLDMNKMEACLKDDSVVEAINKNKEEGKKLGVRSTPSYFVNGTLVVGFKNLKDEIDKIMKEKAN